MTGRRLENRRTDATLIEEEAATTRSLGCISIVKFRDVPTLGLIHLAELAD